MEERNEEEVHDNLLDLESDIPLDESNRCVIGEDGVCSGCE